MISLILALLSLMDSIAAMTWVTAVPPSWATWRALTASWFADWALSAVRFTLLVICSRPLAVSSRLAACSSVRLLRSWLPMAISPEAEAMAMAPSWTWISASRICVMVSLMALPSSA